VTNNKLVKIHRKLIKFHDITEMLRFSSLIDSNNQKKKNKEKKRKFYIVERRVAFSPHFRYMHDKSTFKRLCSRNKIDKIQWKTKQ